MRSRRTQRTGTSLLNCPILSESRAEERREGEPKDPESFSSEMPRQGVSARDLFLHRLTAKQYFPSPVLRQIFPAWIHLLNQRNFLFPAPAFQLPLAALCHIHVVVSFVI